VAGHAVDFWLTTEDPPLPDNRVTTGAGYGLGGAPVLTHRG
jgi:hypothetical protein